MDGGDGVKVVGVMRECRYCVQMLTIRKLPASFQLSIPVYLCHECQHPLLSYGMPKQL